MRNSQGDWPYAGCYVCGGRVEERLQDQTYRRKSGWVLVRGVPTGVCVKCGAGVVKAPVAKMVEKALKSRRRGRTMRIRVVELASA